MRLIDLTGRKFGRWTVIRRSYPNRRTRSMWLCKCECGKEKIVYGQDLRTNHTQSCGCLKTEKSRLTFGLSNLRTLILHYKHNAEKRRLDFNLTEKQFEEITQQNCYYCGAKPNNTSTGKRTFGDYIYNGLDRVDNSKGYTIDNVVPCCKVCNRAKDTITLQEFQDWIEKIYNKRKEVK